MMRITKKPLPQTYELKEPQCFLRIDLRAINRFAYVSRTKQTNIGSIARMFELKIQHSIDDYQKAWLISEVPGVLQTRQGLNIMKVLWQYNKREKRYFYEGKDYSNFSVSYR